MLVSELIQRRIPRQDLRLLGPALTALSRPFFLPHPKNSYTPLVRGPWDSSGLSCTTSPFSGQLLDERRLLLILVTPC